MANMKIRTMNINNLKDPTHEAFNYNTIFLLFVGFFNETTLSLQLKHRFSTNENVKRHRERKRRKNNGLIRKLLSQKYIFKLNSLK